MRYFFGSTEKDWQSAENDCIARGGQLTSVHSKAENDFLTQKSITIFGGVSLWYGGIRVNNTFTWSDGTPFSNKTFWRTGEPNNLGRENCLHMTDTEIGKWNDAPCDHQKRYACKLGKGKCS